MAEQRDMGTAAEAGSNKVLAKYKYFITVLKWIFLVTFSFYSLHLYTNIRTFYFLHWEDILATFAFKSV